MSAEPRRVELTEAERESLFRAGDHHPDHCDCSAFADEVGYAPGSEICDALADTYEVVARIKAAARREALLEAADSYSDFEVFVAADGINSLRTHGLEPDAWIRRYSERYTAEPEHDEEGGR